MFVRLTQPTRSTARSAGCGIHGAPTWRQPYKGCYCKDSIRNWKDWDQIPDARTSPAGLPRGGEYARPMLSNEGDAKVIT